MPVVTGWADGSFLRESPALFPLSFRDADEIYLCPRLSGSSRRSTGWICRSTQVPNKLSRSLPSPSPSRSDQLIKISCLSSLTYNFPGLESLLGRKGKRRTSERRCCKLRRVSLCNPKECCRPSALRFRQGREEGTPTGVRSSKRGERGGPLTSCWCETISGGRRGLVGSLERGRASGRGSLEGTSRVQAEGCGGKWSASQPPLFFEGFAKRRRSVRRKVDKGDDRSHADAPLDHLVMVRTQSSEQACSRTKCRSRPEEKSDCRSGRGWGVERRSWPTSTLLLSSGRPVSFETYPPKIKRKDHPDFVCLDGRVV